MYNGDHHNYEMEATNNFIRICDNIKSNMNFDDVVNVIDTIALSCHNNNLFANETTKDTMFKDLRNIFAGPDNKNSKLFILSALSDAISLFEAAKIKYRQGKSNRSSKKSKTFSSEFPAYDENLQNFTELKNQTHFVGCIKKLEFYLSFINYCYGQNEYILEFIT